MIEWRSKPTTASGSQACISSARAPEKRTTRSPCRRRTIESAPKNPSTSAARSAVPASSLIPLHAIEVILSAMTERRAFPPLHKEDLDADPFAQFARWYELAREEVPLADAMTLATVGDDGAPDARMVLLKGHGPDGFRFFTNYESAKAGQIEADPRGALVIYWREHDRQVRARGPLERLTAADSDAYFPRRARESRLGAWASPQSRPLADRAELDARLDAVRERFDGVEDVPRPDFWGGFLLRPTTIEFWQGQQARLHDRFLYARSPGRGWSIERLG